MICMNSGWSMCWMDRRISRCGQMTQVELQALVVSMRTRGGSRLRVRSRVLPKTRHSACEDSFRMVVMTRHSNSAQTAGWSEASLSRIPAATQPSPRVMIQSTRGLSRAEGLSHGVGNAGGGQEPADLRIVGVAVQIAQQNRRLAQGQVHGDDRTKLLLLFPLVAAGDVRKQDANRATGGVPGPTARHCDSRGRRNSPGECAATTRPAIRSTGHCPSRGDTMSACWGRTATPGQAAGPVGRPGRAAAIAGGRGLPVGPRNRAPPGTWPRARRRAARRVPCSRGC